MKERKKEQKKEKEEERKEGRKEEKEGRRMKKGGEWSVMARSAVVVGAHAQGEEGVFIG